MWLIGTDGIAPYYFFGFMLDPSFFMLRCWDVWGFFNKGNYIMGYFLNPIGHFLYFTLILFYINNIIHDLTILAISLMSIYCENAGGSWSWGGWGNEKIFWGIGDEGKWVRAGNRGMN